MKFFVCLERRSVVIAMRGETGDAVGDMRIEIQPGDSWYGNSYEDLRAMGDGEHEIDVCASCAQDLRREALDRRRGVRIVRCRA